MALLGPWVSPGGGQASTDRARETEGSPTRDGGSLERSGGKEEQTGRGRKLGRREGGLPRKGQNTGQGRRGGHGSTGSVGCGGALGAGVTSLESSSKGLLFLSKGLIFPSLLSLSSFIHSFGHTFTFIQQIFTELLMLQAS